MARHFLVHDRLIETIEAFLLSRFPQGIPSLLLSYNFHWIELLVEDISARLEHEIQSNLHLQIEQSSPTYRTYRYSGLRSPNAINCSSVHCILTLVSSPHRRSFAWFKLPYTKRNATDPAMASIDAPRQTAYPTMYFGASLSIRML